MSPRQVLRSESLAISGVLLIEPADHGDARGFFSEVWSARALAAQGLDIDFAQDNHAASAERGVLRGLHFQRSPAAQGNLVRVARGDSDPLRQGPHGAASRGDRAALPGRELVMRRILVTGQGGQLATGLETAPPAQGFEPIPVGQPETVTAVFMAARPKVLPIATADHPTKATRPADGRPDTSTLSRVFRVAPPPWEAGLARVIRALRAA